MGMPMSCVSGGWVGRGRVGGGEAAWGAWGGNQPGGTKPPRPHRTYRISPHPGGVGGAYAGGPPHLPRGRSAPTWLFSTDFTPQGADIKAGRQGPTWLPGGLASRLIGPGRRLPPFATYMVCVRRTGERIGHGSRHRVASSCPPPCGVLPRPHEAPRRVRGHAYGYTGVYG